MYINSESFNLYKIKQNKKFIEGEIEREDERERTRERERE
jgi:hypothetical protein